MITEIIPYYREPRALAGLAAKLPALFLPDEKTAEHFFGFFTANIRNKNTRRAYYKAACRFARLVREARPLRGQGAAGSGRREAASHRRVYRGAAGRAGEIFGEATPGRAADAL